MKAIALASVAALGVNALSLEKNRPVTKVINLLKDMQKQLETEVEEDAAIYDKMACWCTTNDKEKTQQIADGEQAIAAYTAAIEEGTAKSAKLTTEIANLAKEIAANEKALATATKLRQKNLAEFNAVEKDLLQSIQALGNAVTVLSKHHEGSFLQTESSNIASSLSKVMSHYDLTSKLSPSETKMLGQFMQAPASHLGEYGSQSGEIFGILKQMKETFEGDLKEKQETETKQQQNYEALKKAKEEEIAAGQDQKDKKEGQLAETDEKVANDKQSLEDERNQLAANEEFLANLKEKCKQTDAEFAARQKTRTDEITAVSKALEFLSSDEAHDLFTRTFNFVQVSSSEMQKRRDAAASVLRSKNLNAMAVMVQLDAFTKVKQMIDQLVAELKKTSADEVKEKDFCNTELNNNDAEHTKLVRDEEDAQTKKAQLEGQIATLQKEIEAHQATVAETQTQLKRAGEDREKQNLEFQTTVQDQRATQKLLTQALDVLKGFYEKKALLQEPAGPPPPAGFKSYENNAGGGGVIGMITQIINDAKAMEAEALHDEADAQSAYESFVKDSNNTIKTEQESIETKKATKAGAEEDLAETNDDIASLNTSITQNRNKDADLHSRCDFLLKNFDLRQSSREDEVEALNKAKAILSGSDQTASN